jgi:hypothetical protein
MQYVADPNVIGEMAASQDEPQMVADRCMAPVHRGAAAMPGWRVPAASG